MSKNYFLILFVLVSQALLGAAPTDSTAVELKRVWPEPFHDYLKFEFAVNDTGVHQVKIMILNGENDLVFMEKAPIYKGHETITINTIDFSPPGTYAIKVKIDNKYNYLRKFKFTE